MNKNLRVVFSKTILAVGIAGASTVTQAGSFGLIEQSASGQGAAYAGAAAIAEDASTIYFNPAGMTRLPGSQIVVAGHIISAEAKYTDSGNSTTFAGSPLQGPNSTTDETGFVPNFYYSTELDNGVFVGVGVNVPFGLATEYDAGWIGRYHALKSQISSININPSIAWKATDSISVGFGISVQYIDLELTSNIDSMAACLNLQNGFGVPGTPCAAYTVPGNAAQDSSLKLDADSTEMGWNAGILIDLSDKARLGIAYRSAIKHNASGNAVYSLNDQGLQQLAAGLSSAPPAGSGFNILQNTSIGATAELPESFAVSYVRDIDSQWTLLADWTWTGWSSLDMIVIREAGGVPGQERALELLYANTNRYSVGVHFKADNKWTYRGGIAFDETPIRSAENTSARIPGNDRKWISLGLGYTPSPDWSLDFGYSHLFLSDPGINNTGSTTSGATLIGSYEASVDILSAQANFNF